MKPIILVFFTVFSIITFQLPAFGQQDNWSHFRGSNLDGISKDQNVPIHWNDSVNVIWKTRLIGKGWSSPVVFGNQLWVSSATKDGKEMYGICLSLKSGKEIYRIKIFEPAVAFAKHEINTFASPTPCIEHGYVYVHFGTYGTSCINTTNGSIVWKRTDLNCDHVQGPGASPIIYKNLLILHLEGVDRQYLVALDKKTGKTVWKKDRPKDCYDKLDPIGKKAYITPVIINVKGKDLLISNGSAACIAYNPVTGEEVWRVVQGEDSTISMPFSENGIVYFYSGFVTPKEGEKYAELLAVDPTGTGDVTSTHVLWRFRSPILQLLTPLVKDGLIYTIDSKNNLFCLDAKTGMSVYTKRLNGKYNSSPVYAAGKVYFTSTSGETLIIKEGRVLDIIGRNKINGEVFATPAIVNNSIVIRAGDNIYCIGSH